ncbi:hypothetical protein HON36_01930 [Candidatus Parcubacteria bacterium]|jgi:hypothetical protein|nr:hypothetical protein [Candidatus Parcubacteria bacterium]MBT7228435.1 hypothetical protein [Candidatus Parcubacteria bacterium]
MKVCEQLKTNLGELHYLVEDLQAFVDAEKYTEAIVAKRQIDVMIIEMHEPLDWAVDAKKNLEGFLSSYVDKRIDIELKNEFSDAGTDWMKIEKNCRVDIEHRKIYIKPKDEELDLSRMEVVLPRNAVIEGDLILDQHTKELPDDLIVKGRLILQKGDDFPGALMQRIELMDFSGNFYKGFSIRE